MNTSLQIYAALVYVKLWIEDTIDYYYSYLILSLPVYMFGIPIFTIKSARSDFSSDSNSDSDADQKTECTISEVLITRVCLIHYDNKKRAYNTELHGNQLRHFVDEYGKFFIGHIDKYYSNLDTIILSYVKIQSSDDEARLITRIIDVKKRYDVRNLQSCKMGVKL